MGFCDLYALLPEFLPDGFSLPQYSSENGVYEAHSGARQSALGRFHSLVNRRVRWNVVHYSQLVETDQEKRHHIGTGLPVRASAYNPFEHALTFDNSVDYLGDEGPVLSDVLDEFFGENAGSEPFLHEVSCHGAGIPGIQGLVRLSLRFITTSHEAYCIRLECVLARCALPA